MLYCMLIFILLEMQIISYSIFTNILFYYMYILLLNSAQAQKREKSYETIITGGQTQYINTADNTHNYDVIGYRRERRQESRS